MRDIIRTSNSIYPNVTYYFYRYEPTLTEPYHIDGDTVLIRGTETYVPGILEKTLFVFSLFQNTEADYIVRTNISTIIDFDALGVLLQTRMPAYAGYRDTIRWIDPRGGFTDGRFWGMTFITGCYIVLSQATLRFLCDTVDLVDHTIIDDVALAHFFHKQGMEAEHLDVRVMNASDLVINKCVYYNNHLYHENPSLRFRSIDVKNMAYIVDRLRTRPLHP